jgi:ubiquinone/menaquinone biosynthesis C-methylase UbiE
MLDALLKQDQVADVYRRIAPVYDLWARLTESKARDLCIEAAAVRDGESLLEVAVGTGLAFEKLIRANPSGRNEGIDLTAAMLARAEKRADRSGIRNYCLRIGNALQLDYPDNEFDVLVNNYMFDLLPESDFEPVLAEFRRVLRPGGRLVLVNMTEGEHWYNGLWAWVYSKNPAWLGGCRGVQLSRSLAECGYANIQRQYVSQMTFPSEVIHCVVR